METEIMKCVVRPLGAALQLVPAVGSIHAG